MTERVLIVDADAVFRKDLARLLSGAGYECETAPDGKAAIRLADAFRPHVVLCSFATSTCGCAQGGQASDLLGYLASEHPSCAVLVMTLESSGEGLLALEKGATDVLYKPTVPTLILDRLAAILKA